jgi:hypothetical protein
MVTRQPVASRRRNSWQAPRRMYARPASVRPQRSSTAMPHTGRAAVLLRLGGCRSLARNNRRRAWQHISVEPWRRCDGGRIIAAFGETFRAIIPDMSCMTWTQLMWTYVSGCLAPALDSTCAMHLRPYADCVALLNTYQRTILMLQTPRHEAVPAAMRARGHRCFATMLRTSSSGQ